MLLTLRAAALNRLPGRNLMKLKAKGGWPQEVMACKKCKSENQSTFNGKVATEGLGQVHCLGVSKARGGV
jgi:hypothetical protein